LVGHGLSHNDAGHWDGIGGAFNVPSAGAKGFKEDEKYIWRMITEYRDGLPALIFFFYDNIMRY
jgi:hypothetical protein